MSDATDIQVLALNGGNFRMDGGCMFGVIPKPLWEKRTPADANNRIAMQSTCVVVKTRECNVLIDTGYGNKHDSKFRDNHVLQHPSPLIAELKAVDLEPSQIDLVVLSHLHFDHAGGCTFRTEDGTLLPQFPNARYLIHRAEWEDANSGSPELAGAYFSEDFLALETSRQVDLVEDGHMVIPGITLQHTGGHTRGHQIVHIKTASESYCFASDFCPTAAHLPPFWTLSYDQDYLHLRRLKPKVLGELADNGTIVIFGHDPVCPAARIARDERRGFVVAEKVNLSSTASKK